MLKATLSDYRKEDGLLIYGWELFSHMTEIDGTGCYFSGNVIVEGEKVIDYDGVSDYLHPHVIALLDAQGLNTDYLTKEWNWETNQYDDRVAQVGA